ncbi:MAG: hybrid sensor histidine kinase/response regulator [Puniceicoccaceae bacterium]
MHLQAQQHPNSQSAQQPLMRCLLSLCFLLTTLQLTASARIFPSSLQEVYPLRDFGIHEPQSIGQLPDGRIVTVTDSGKLFVFTGTGWQLLPKQLPVGSMKVFTDSQNTLWVGGLGFFGYVDAEFQFHDVSRQLFSDHLESTLSVLWFYETGDWLHFANNKTLFHFNRTTGERKTTVFEGMFEAYRWMWDGKLYLGGREHVRVWQGDAFVHEVDWTHEHQAFVGWKHQGRSYFLNVHHLSVFENGSQVETIKDPLMQLRGASHVMTDSCLYVFTLQGVLRIDRSGNCEGYFTHFFHQPLTRANIRFHTNFGGDDLWMLTGNAILRTDLTSGIQPLEVTTGYAISGLWDMTHFDGRLFTSSNEGLKSWHPEAGALKLLGDPSPDFETASLWHWNDRLLVSSWIELGSFDGEQYQIHRSDGSYRVFAFAEQNDHFWVSRDTGALLLNADFEIVREVHFPREIVSMVEHEGQLWVTTLFGEVLSFHLETNDVLYKSNTHDGAAVDSSLRILQRVFTHGGRLFLQRPDAILEWHADRFHPLPLPLEPGWRWEIPQCCNEAKRILLIQRHTSRNGAKVGAFIADPNTSDFQWEHRWVPLNSPTGFIRSAKFLEDFETPLVAILSQSMIELMDLSSYPTSVNPPPPPLLVRPISHFAQSDPSPFSGLYHAREERPMVLQLHNPASTLETPLQYYGRLLGKTEWLSNTTGTFEFYGILRGTQTFEGYSVDPYGNPSPVVRQEIRVVPPWYLSNGAITVALVVLVLCIIGVAHWQTRRLRSQARKLQEKVDQQTEDLIRANHAKSIFVSNVSHEIRNPLNGLLGLAQNLKPGDVLDGPTLERLRRPSLYLYRFLSNVLDFSKFESGGIRFTPRIMDPNELIDSVHSMFSGDFESRQLHFIGDYRYELRPFVIASQEAIEMMLVNLVGNAVKYTPEGGSIRVAMLKSQGELRFSVSDTGIGIAAEDLDRIFEPYQQGGHLPLISGEKGAGIGLSLVQHTLKQIGGSISVRSERGEGSCFAISIPITDPDPETAPVEVSEVRLKGRYLIIEDLAYNRKLFMDLLRSWGAEVAGVANAAEARQVVVSEDFDMIFMDYDLPDGNGVELTAEFRSLPSPQHTPIVGLSAYTDQEFIQSALRSGMSDYLFKPLNPQQLVECLKRLLPDHIQFTQKQTTTRQYSRTSLRRLSLASDATEQTLHMQLESFQQAFDSLVDELQQCDLGSANFHSLVHQLKGLSSYIQHRNSLAYWQHLMDLTTAGQRKELMDALDQLPSVVQRMHAELRELEALEHDFEQLQPAASPTQSLAQVTPPSSVGL